MPPKRAPPKRAWHHDHQSSSRYYAHCHYCSSYPSSCSSSSCLSSFFRLEFFLLELPVLSWPPPWQICASPRPEVPLSFRLAANASCEEGIHMGPWGSRLLEYSRVLPPWTCSQDVIPESITCKVDPRAPQLVGATPDRSFGCCTCLCGTPHKGTSMRKMTRNHAAKGKKQRKKNKGTKAGSEERRMVTKFEVTRCLLNVWGPSIRAQGSDFWTSPYCTV